jgi:hypothetical protein
VVPSYLWRVLCAQVTLAPLEEPRHLPGWGVFQSDFPSSPLASPQLGVVGLDHSIFGLYQSTTAPATAITRGSSSGRRRLSGSGTSAAESKTGPPPPDRLKDSPPPQVPFVEKTRTGESKKDYSGAKAY